MKKFTKILFYTLFAIWGVLLITSFANAITYQAPKNEENFGIALDVGINIMFTVISAFGLLSSATPIIAIRKEKAYGQKFTLFLAYVTNIIMYSTLALICIFDSEWVLVLCIVYFISFVMSLIASAVLLYNGRENAQC